MTAQPLMTTEEVANRLNISRAHLYRLCRQQRIPHTRLPGGTSIRFDRAEIEQWLAEQYKPVAK